MASKDLSSPAERASRPEAAPPPSAPAAPDPAIPDPIVAKDADGQERPLSGGSFICIDGKLVRQEA